MKELDLEIKLGQSSGGITNTTVEPVKVKWSDFKKAFSEPKVGNKDGNYFTCITFNTYKRSSKYSEGMKASIFVLDGDSSTDETILGAPDPASVHEVLKKHDITHCICSSYSNGIKGHRYRVIIPAGWTGKEELTVLVESVITLLHQEGVMLADVPENKNISGAWFFPRVKDEEAKKDFMFYQHDGGMFTDLIDAITKQSLHDNMSNIAESLRKDNAKYNQKFEDNDYTEESVTQALGTIPADCIYSDWIKILMSLHSTGEDWAFDAAVEWSSKGEKFKDKADVKKHWDSFGDTPMEGITIASLFYASSQALAQPITPLPVNNADPLAWTNALTVSDQEMDSISNPEWIIKNLVIQGHIVTIAAEPNGGKTTLFLHLAGEMVDAGYNVHYVNADTGGGDAKAMHVFAKEHGFKLLLPDMSGNSMDHVVNKLAGMNEAKIDYSDIVFIFDTLKKMANVISKTNTKNLYALLRGLTAKGMTIILLAHTNKYKNDAGSAVYEGTGDVRSDSDELIYLEPEKKTGGTMIITTRPDKVRGTFELVTYMLDKNRNVSLHSTVIDTVAHTAALVRIEKDQTTIDAIDSAIADGFITQSKIVEQLLLSGISRNATLKVLKKYSSEKYKVYIPEDHQLWGISTGGKNNRKEYSALKTE